MSNYEHKKIIDQIIELNNVPKQPDHFSEWVNSTANIELLINNETNDELINYLSSKFLFVDSLVIPNKNLTPIDMDDLLAWSFSPTHSIASYVTVGGREDIWIERGFSDLRTKSLHDAKRLIFYRTFNGLQGDGRRYFELLQEYSHLCEIHWRPERSAYCRFDENGDFEPIVTISMRENIGIDVDLVTFKWEPLENYLVISDSALVRFFDFTLYKPSEFGSWPDQQPQVVQKTEQLFYRQLIDPGQASYTRGFQIIKPRRNRKQVFTDIDEQWFGKEDRKYAEFLTYDWRNKKVTNISTDPKATSNYFNAEGNSLPFEVSPAFFNPEVLSKYKADKDKYKIGERDISCRGAWYLKGYDVNDAGQIHAYICDLRNLPYKEQLHWLSHNEQPKTSISERAYLNDFKAEWVDFMKPLQQVLSIARRWQSDMVDWWSIKDEEIINRVTEPLTESRDEWAESFMDLSKLIIEGFQLNIIRAKLDELNVDYEQKEMSIILLEKIINHSKKTTSERRLDGLRTIQRIRSKVKGHSIGSEAKSLIYDAKKEYESFNNHFQHICSLLVDEMRLIQEILN